MRGMKGRLLKRLKTMSLSLKQDRVLLVKAEDGFNDSVNSIIHATKNLLVRKDAEKKSVASTGCCRAPFETEAEAEIVDISELMKDLKDEEEEEIDASDEKENITPQATKKWLFPEKEYDDSNSERCSPPSTQRIPSNRNRGEGPVSESNVTPAMRRTRPGSGSLFDPDLLAAFEKAVMDHILSHEAEKRAEAQALTAADQESDRTSDAYALSEFEERCPPGGSESIVLYTTTIRAIRKTFEECNTVRHVLCTLRILFDERDVSMHMQFREELKVLMSTGKAISVVPPRLFIKGRFIGGAQEVLGLHEQGKLVALLQGVVRNRTMIVCDGCRGVRFVLCFHCSGSCKLASCDSKDMKMKCPHCNENGLIRCPMCVLN